MYGKYVVRCIKEDSNEVWTVKIRFDSYREEGDHTYFKEDDDDDFETIIPTKLIESIDFIEYYHKPKKPNLPREESFNYVGAMKWIEVEDQLKTADFVYNNTDLKNKLLYRLFIKPLAKRYEAGEKTDDLYNRIMNIKM